MSDQKKKFELDRRAFILAGTAAVATLAAPRLSAAGLETDLVSVGFWGGMPNLLRRSGMHGTLISAEALTTSDPSLAGTGALISIRGLWRAEQNRSARTRYSIDALFTAEGEPSKVPLLAWSYSSMTKTPTQSGRVSFPVPVDAPRSLDFEFRRMDSVATVSFSVTTAPGKLMLDRGVYVVAFLDENTPRPDWKKIELLPGSSAFSFDQKDGLIGVRSGNALVEPWFDYVVLAVGVPEAEKKSAEALRRESIEAAAAS
jgi:hypothetical protein